MHRRTSILVALTVGATATSSPSGVVGHPVVFGYHSAGADPGIAQVGVMLTVARAGDPGRYTRTELRAARLTASGSTEDFALGLDGAPGAGRGTCFTARLAVPATSRLGAKRAGDTVRVVLMVAGHRFTRDVKLRRVDLDGSSRAERATIRAAGCRPPLAR
jgi:hypothetical protein